MASAASKLHSRRRPGGRQFLTVVVCLMTAGLLAWVPHLNQSSPGKESRESAWNQEGLGAPRVNAEKFEEMHDEEYKKLSAQFVQNSSGQANISNAGVLGSNVESDDEPNITARAGEHKNHESEAENAETAFKDRAAGASLDIKKQDEINTEIMVDTEDSESEAEGKSERVTGAEGLDSSTSSESFKAGRDNELVEDGKPKILPAGEHSEVGQSEKAKPESIYNLTSAQVLHKDAEEDEIPADSATTVMSESESGSHHDSRKGTSFDDEGGTSSGTLGKYRQLDVVGGDGKKEDISTLDEMSEVGVNDDSEKEVGEQDEVAEANKDLLPHGRESQQERLQVMTKNEQQVTSTSDGKDDKQKGESYHEAEEEEIVEEADPAELDEQNSELIGTEESMNVLKEAGDNVRDVGEGNKKNSIVTDDQKGGVLAEGGDEAEPGNETMADRDSVRSNGIGQVAGREKVEDEEEGSAGGEGTRDVLRTGTEKVEEGLEGGEGDGEDAVEEEEGEGEGEGTGEGGEPAKERMGKEKVEESVGEEGSQGGENTAGREENMEEEEEEGERGGGGGIVAGQEVGKKEESSEEGVKGVGGNVSETNEESVEGRPKRGNTMDGEGDEGPDKEGGASSMNDEGEEASHVVKEGVVGIVKTEAIQGEEGLEEPQRQFMKRDRPVVELADAIVDEEEESRKAMREAGEGGAEEENLSESGELPQPNVGSEEGLEGSVHDEVEKLPTEVDAEATRRELSQDQLNVGEGSVGEQHASLEPLGAVQSGEPTASVQLQKAADSGSTLLRLGGSVLSLPKLKEEESEQANIGHAAENSKKSAGERGRKGKVGSRVRVSPSCAPGQKLPGGGLRAGWPGAIQQLPDTWRTPGLREYKVSAAHPKCRGLVPAAEPGAVPPDYSVPIRTLNDLMKAADNGERLLVIAPRFGLGNSLRAYASAWTYALLTNRRIVILNAGLHYGVYVTFCQAFACGFDHINPEPLEGPWNISATPDILTPPDGNYSHVQSPETLWRSFRLSGRFKNVESSMIARGPKRLWDNTPILFTYNYAMWDGFYKGHRPMLHCALAATGCRSNPCIHSRAMAALIGGGPTEALSQTISEVLWVHRKAEPKTTETTKTRSKRRSASRGRVLLAENADVTAPYSDGWVSQRWSETELATGSGLKLRFDLGLHIRSRPLAIEMPRNCARNNHACNRRSQEVQQKIEKEFFSDALWCCVGTFIQELAIQLVRKEESYRLGVPIEQTLHSPLIVNDTSGLGRPLSIFLATDNEAIRPIIVKSLRRFGDVYFNGGPVAHTAMASASNTGRLPTMAEFFLLSKAGTTLELSHQLSTFSQISTLLGNGTLVTMDTKPKKCWRIGAQSQHSASLQ